MQPPRIPSNRHRAAVSTLALLCVAAAAAGCGAGDESRSTTTDGAPRAAKPGVPNIRLVPVGRFASPVDAIAVPGTDLVAVVEKGGRVLVAQGMTCAASDRCPAKPVSTGTVVLDVSKNVSTGSEQGLLGVAFHPNWPDDPRIFVDYTDRQGDTHLEAWKLETPTGTATRDRELLRIDQPFANHNGGHVEFGPDGLLYVGMGDGGSGGDPADRAQKVDELLGKLLRLDVDHGGERGFAIPKGNVHGGAPEVWAIGLRNPWRFSFDRRTGDLWIADVGQDAREEIDAVRRSRLDDRRTLNFEWRRREGFDAFDGSGVRGPGEQVQPVLDYGRNEGCSITGGVVYRGRLVPKLDGWYLFTDFCAHDLRLLRAAGIPGSHHSRGELRWRSTAGANAVVSFGVVQRDEVLVVSLDGSIRQVVAG